MKKVMILILLSSLLAFASSDSRSFDVGANPRLNLGNISGKVDIQAGNSNSVEISWTQTDDRIKVEIEQNQDKIDVEVKYPKGNSQGGVDFTISFPAQGRLDISTVSGNINVDGISGELELNSVSGDVDLNNTSGDLELNTVSGEITLTNIGEAELEAETVSGVINYEGNFVGGDYEFSSVSGRLNLTVGSDAHFDLEGSAMKATTNIEVEGLEITKEAYTGFKSISGSVNGGGAKVEVSTISGSITIK